ncbi:uncharacterized protein LOC100828780 isoform X1 [Brachypodium distachyon]|uniref:uncharacterized protein LOC100828780 isoform X1 n=1 Tax=Brachypodium distachyon TaxID=15368 RepID=UPI0001C71F78|nr:uncharacterized protein LOC100828780 isoform X1 [Brachypodium distachyon]|eukprot:XP_003565765.1 uncharacterized protein LOC100828780 isoform X1 [Brachypodium distachyon]
MATSLLNLLLMEVAAIVSIVLLSLLVVLSSYRRRAGHPALRLFVWAASTLFLPLVSYAVSAAAKWDAARVPLLLAWTVFLQILRNTVDTARSSSLTIDSTGGSSGSSKFRPSVEQLARMGWVAFLIISSGGNAGSPQLTGVLLWLWVLSLVKLIHRLVAAELAKNSFAVGLNAYLISDYMKQLYGQQEDLLPHGEEDSMPPYLVMGEEKLHIEARPRGYRIGQTSLSIDAGHVVTVDRIWRLSSTGDSLLASYPQIKDLCLSFSLFKLQLRRFLGCPLAEVGSRRALAFVQDGLLGAGSSPERAFRVIETELSFLADLLYSKLTSFYASGWWFPVLNSTLVLATWMSCLAAGGAIVHDMTNRGTALAVDYNQLRSYLQNHDTIFHAIVGLDMLVTVSFIIAIVFTEGWEIANYVRSDWIKVATLCEYARRPSWRKSPWTRRKLGRVLRFKAVQRWDDRFGQSSVLQPRMCYCGCVSRHVDRIAKTSVAVPAWVKSAIVTTLRTNQGSLVNGVLSLRRNGVADKLVWACRIGAGGADDGIGGDETSISEQILVWHVATRLLEIKRSDQGAHGSSDNVDADGGHEVVATHLSRYCAYLVAMKPELLPDHPAWTEELYEGVVEEATRVLARCAGPLVRYERLATCLGGSTNQALRKASKLGRQLAEEVGNEELVWKVLAEFWAELIVFLAPSENVTAHAKSLRRGGEFITVLWALLGHAGIVSRPETYV